MSKLKEAAALALDALEYNIGSLIAGVTYDMTEKAISALRAALAESEPTGERAELIARLRSYDVFSEDISAAADMLEADAP